jgi:hypothetical protein
MGWTHFLTKTLARVRTEMSLHVLAYNLKRVMRILGIGELMRAMSAWAARLVLRFMSRRSRPYPLIELNNCR